MNSSDTVPVLIAMGATLRLQGPEGEREVEAADFFAIEDGREWLARKPGELLTEIVVPDQSGTKSSYRKLRRRGTFDFAVLGVAARVRTDGNTVSKADVILNAVGPAPIRCHDAERALVGSTLEDAAIEAAMDLAPSAAKPLDNTDYMPSWRKKMIRVFVKRALEDLRA